MKKFFLSLIAVIYVSYSLYAVPASPEPFVFVQPDGSKLTLYGRGDEYYHWIETDGNDIVVKNNGCYEYATIVNNQIVASGIAASSQISPASKSQLSTRDELIKLMLQKRSLAIAQIDSVSKLEDSGSKSIPLTEGNQKVLCILIGFPDMPFSKTQADFVNMWNQIGYNYEGSQGSVKDFYLENSYGLLNVTATVVGPYVASHNSSYYDYDNGDYKALIKEAMQAAKNDVQFSEFDVNNNYFVDLVHVVFAGYSKSVPGSDGVIWPHSGTLTLPVWQGLYRAKDYICSSELAGYSGTKVAPIGTVCHEYGHDLGAPDYYDLSSSGFPGTGHWDVMCNGSWNNQGRCPAHHNPYTKAYIYNWVTPMEINSSLSNMEYFISPSYNLPIIYKINTNTSGEFFLLENKKKLGFNSQIPGYANDGLLIYHIHSDIENAISNHNVNTSHPQKCYIVNANAASNPNSSPSSYGTDDTQWAYPTNNQIFFTSTSTPSAISWAGEATGANLCFIRKYENYIKFTVNPIITGPSVLDSVATYSVANIPSNARIKWTYTAIVMPNIQMLHNLCPPLKFVNGDSTSIISVQRGKYLTGLVFPYDTIIFHSNHNIQAPGVINDEPLIDRGWKYYTGNIILKAIISCGGDTIRLVKQITLPLTNTASYITKKKDLQIVNDKYRLIHPNPSVSTNIPIYIYKGNGEDLSPMEEPYTIELRDSRNCLVTKQNGTTAYLSLETNNIPRGIYYLTLIVKGEIKATNKLFINQ